MNRPNHDDSESTSGNSAPSVYRPQASNTSGRVFGVGSCIGLMFVITAVAYVDASDSATIKWWSDVIASRFLYGIFYSVAEMFILVKLFFFACCGIFRFIYLCFGIIFLIWGSYEKLY